MKSRAKSGVFLLICLAFCAGALCQQEPASEGRPITPAGTLVIAAATHLPAVGAMPMAMLRSPDALGQGGKGRYLLVVNSGFGVQFSEETNRAQQSIAVIDLNASPGPLVIQDVYFPTPESAVGGLACSHAAGADGTFTMYVSGGFENKVWVFRFDPKVAAPVQPGSNGPDTKVQAPSFEISKPGEVSRADYNKGKAALYPTGLAVTADGATLVTANNLGDSVTIVRDLQGTRRMERLDLHHPGKPAENTLSGASTEGIALSDDEKALYVANAHSNAVAVVELSEKARGGKKMEKMADAPKSKTLGFIPTGQYPSAVAFADGRLFIGNGKGTGFESSSMRVNNSGRTPNAPNSAFPPNEKKNRQGGQYSGSIVSGNISVVALPDLPQLSRYTQQTLQNDGLMGFAPARLFPGPNPIKHVIYITKENRTYDQVFCDLKASGDGTAADGEPAFAIFGNGATAQRPDGTPQTVTPNHHALAQRFGLFDRFFVNSEASPDGHNWATAAFSTDYVDKAFRWNYSGRGRTYDFEGYNRLPDYEPPGDLQLDKFKGDALAALTDFLEKHLPYRQGFTDLCEPKTLYLWDAAARAVLTYRNYGE